ncbi:MAG: beta strand repeat-containing protein [Lacipirellulaceae bacterium]
MRNACRCALTLLATAVAATSPCRDAHAVDVAVYEFNADSPGSTDADAATTAGAWTQTVGGISGGNYRVDGTMVGGTIGGSVGAAQYASFTINPNGNPLDLSRLAIDYNAENPFEFVLGVFASTDGGATGFTAANQLFGLRLPDVGGVAPVTVRTSSSFLDLGSLSSLQGVTAPVEFRIYLADNSGNAARVHLIDNVRLTGLASTVNDPRWNVNASGSWQTAASWQPAAVPAAGANVVFGDVATSDRTVTLASNVTVNRIAFSGADAAYTITPAATQSITLTGAAEVRASGAQEHVIAARVSGSAGLTKEGGGDVTLTNATNNYTGATNVNAGALRVTSPGALQGPVNAAAGSVLVFEGNAAGGGYNGTFANALSGTGTATLSDSLTTETVTMNAAKSFGGVYRVEGGTLAVSNAGAFGTGGTNASRTEVTAGTGKVAISGNVTAANEVLALNARGTDAVHLTSAGNNAWNGDVAGRAGLGQYNVESTSGTLTLGGRLSGFDVLNGVDRTYVFSGAGNTTVTGLLTDDAIADDGTRVAGLANNVSVVKRGAGTLTISTESSNVADYHRGATVVEQGTLRVTAGAGDVGELSSRSVVVESGATLDLTDFGTYNMQAQASLGLVQSFGGSGTINAGTFGYFDDASLSPGDGVGTLTLNGAMNMTAFGPSPLGALNYQLSNVTTVGAGVNDLLDVNGSLTANASGGNFAVNVTPSNGGFATGTYRLIEYNGTLGGSATGANFTPTVVDANGVAVGATRQSFAVSTATAGQVNLVVTGAAQNLTWSGATSGAWDVATTANWNAGAQQFFNLDGVTFDTTASTFNVAVPANVLPSSLTFNATGNTYTFSGAGGIGGSGPVNVNSGTVVLDNVGNSFTGTVTVANGATLQIGAGAANQARLPVGETPYVVNGSLVINELSGGETINGAVSGSGTVTVQSSQLTLAGNNAGYTGAIVAAAGTTLNINNADTGSPLGSTATGTTIGVGATLVANEQAATVAEPLALNGGALRAGGGTNSRLNWSGNITLGAGGAGEIRQDSGSNTPTSVGLTVSGSIGGAAGQDLRLRVDADSTTVVTGAVQHNGGLSKTGVGRAELRGTNTFTGNTTVEAGTLAIVGSSDLANSPRVHVQAGAELDARGRTGGGLAVGASRTLDVSGAVAGNTSAASGSTIAIGGDGAATIGPRTVRFTPPSGVASTNSDVRVRSGTGANANQNDTASLGIGSISATDSFRSLLTFDLASTGIADPNFINDVSLTLTLQAQSGAQVNTPSAPSLELLTIQSYNSDTATFNNSSFATTGASPPAALISTTTGPNFTSYATGDKFGWSDSTTDANPDTFVNAVKTALGSSLHLGARAAVTSPTTTTRSFYFIDQAETATPGGAPSLAITYTDPSNPFVTGVGSAVFEGDLTTAAGSTLEIDVFNTSVFDSINVNGSASLSGLLAVDALDVSRLAINDTFTILTANSIANNLTLGGPDGGLFSLSSSTATSLILRYTGIVPLPGDFNGDRIVNAADYTVWRDNLGSTEGSLLSGNGNGGVIDQSDYTLWTTNYGAAAPSTSLANAVPEPTAAALALFASVAASCSRRRR